MLVRVLRAGYSLGLVRILAGEFVIDRMALFPSMFSRIFELRRQRDT